MPGHSGRRGPSPLAILAAAAAVVLLVRRMFPVRVDGTSMSPTLKPGDLVACSRVRGPLKRRAIVVVRGSPDVIKRIDSIHGDEVFVLGDNPAASTDSRTTGLVAAGDLAGIARAIYWPPRRWRLL